MSKSRDEILIKSTRDPLFGMTRDEVIAFLSRSLENRCVEAYLYGSFARGELDARSDIDCMIVQETDLRITERTEQFSDLRLRLPSLEILVYTPEEFSELTGDPSPGFWRSVVREMIKIV